MQAHDLDVVAMREARDRGAHVVERHRADLAQILGDDHVGRELGELRVVDRVDAERVAITARTAVSIARLDAARRRSATRVSTARSRISGGKSHSCEMPTSSSAAPSAHTISVADGKSEITRGEVGIATKLAGNALSSARARRR